MALQQQKLWYDRGPGWLISKPSRFPARSVVKNLSANAGEMRSIPGLGRTPGGGHGYLLYSCLGNPKDREAWWATVHGVAKNRTRLSNRTTTTTSTFLQIRLYGTHRRLFKSPFSSLTSLPAWTANRHLNSILMYVPSASATLGGECLGTSDFGDRIEHQQDTSYEPRGSLSLL